MTGKTLVTGATGTVGSAVVQALQAQHAAFVAASRDASKAKEKLGSDVEVVNFEFSDPATYEKATQGVERVFLIGPPLVPHLDQLMAPFVNHLKQKGINRVVYLSVLGAEEVANTLPYHANMEKMLRDQGFSFTILRPTFFAQNFKNYEWDNIVNRKVLYIPAGDKKVGIVDIKDVGEVAAKVLVEPGYEGKTYKLTGPESLSYHDAARMLSEIRKEPIHYPAPTPDEYAQMLRSVGAPDFVGQYMNAVYSLIRDGHVDYISQDIENLLGRKPGKLQSVLERDLGV